MCCSAVIDEAAPAGPVTACISMLCIFELDGLMAETQILILRTRTNWPVASPNVQSMWSAICCTPDFLTVSIWPDMTGVFWVIGGGTLKSACVAFFFSSPAPLLISTSACRCVPFAGCLFVNLVGIGSWLMIAVESRLQPVAESTMMQSQLVMHTYRRLIGTCVWRAIHGVVHMLGYNVWLLNI